MRTISRRQIAEALTWERWLAALRRGFLEGSRGTCVMPERHHHTVEVPGGEAATLLLMPAWTPGRYLGVKMASVCPGNPSRGLDTIQATYLLTSADSGEALASLDGGELTARRTAAASALAAGFLAREDARRLLVVGTGRLAPLVAFAHASVRPIDQVEVWGRDARKAAAVCEELQRSGLTASVSEQLEGSVRQADVVSCVTSAKAPLVLGQWLRPGTHLDLVGSFTREMREADDDAVSRSRVFVDSHEAALAESGELLHALDTGTFAAGDVVADLFDLCSEANPGRQSPADITLFKSVGVALEDLFAAAALYEAMASE